MVRRIGRHELIDRSAALTYYSILSLVPGLLVLFSVIGILGDQGTVGEVLEILEEVGPNDVEGAARDPLASLLEHDAQSGTLLGLGILAILWTASAYIGSFFRASATVWGVERRPVSRAWPLRMALTITFLILLALALLLIVLTGQLARSIGDALGIGDSVLGLYSFFKWPALLVVLTLLIGLLYRASPSRERSATRWRVLTPGGAAAMVAWLLVSAGFNVYANAFAGYETTYGALGTMVAGLVWLWLTNLTLLMGVELDAALEFRKETTAPHSSREAAAIAAPPASASLQDRSPRL
jgi:membrane protein